MVNFNKIGATPGSPQYAGSQSGSPQTSMPPGFGMPSTYPSSFASMSPDSYYDSNHEVSWNNQYSYHNYLQHHVGMAAHNQIVAQPVAPSQTAISISDWSGDEANNPSAVINNQPSPTMTICGSEGSSPRAPSTPQSLANNNNNNISTANNNNSSAPSTSSSTINNNVTALQSADEEDSKAFNRQIHTRSPYEWMKRTSYQNQPNPGKTRTKDKYRVVYTDHQRLELEKEFHYSRYITIRRKAELAQALGLSERQVKIWFQNRRAKDRKLAKKANEGQIKDSKEMLHNSQGLTGLNGSFGLNYMSNIMPAYSSHPSHLSSAMHMSHHPASTVCAGPPFNALHAAAGLPQHQVHHQHGHSHQQHSMMQYPVVGV